jgi:hypothetical protein
MFINLFEILRLARHFDPSIHKDLQLDFNFERVLFLLNHDSSSFKASIHDYFFINISYFHFYRDLMSLLNLYLLTSKFLFH